MSLIFQDLFSVQKMYKHLWELAIVKWVWERERGRERGCWASIVSSYLFYSMFC